MPRVVPAPGGPAGQAGQPRGGGHRAGQRGRRHPRRRRRRARRRPRHRRPGRRAARRAPAGRADHRGRVGARGGGRVGPPALRAGWTPTASWRSSRRSRTTPRRASRCSPRGCRGSSGPAGRSSSSGRAPGPYRLAESAAAPETVAADLPWLPLERTVVIDPEVQWVPGPWTALDTELAAAPLGLAPRALVVGRPGGPAFRPSELARLTHLTGIIATVLAGRAELDGPAVGAGARLGRARAAPRARRRDGARSSRRCGPGCPSTRGRWRAGSGGGSPRACRWR